MNPQEKFKRTKSGPIDWLSYCIPEAPHLTHSKSMAALNRSLSWQGKKSGGSGAAPEGGQNSMGSNDTKHTMENTKSHHTTIKTSTQQQQRLSSSSSDESPHFYYKTNLRDELDELIHIAVYLDKKIKLRQQRAMENMRADIKHCLAIIHNREQKIEELEKENDLLRHQLDVTQGDKDTLKQNLKYEREFSEIMLRLDDEYKDDEEKTSDPLKT